MATTRRPPMTSSRVTSGSTRCSSTGGKERWPGKRTDGPEAPGALRSYGGRGSSMLGILAEERPGGQKSLAKDFCLSSSADRLGHRACLPGAYFPNTVTRQQEVSEVC